MVPIARRNLLAEKLRLAIAIGGVVQPGIGDLARSSSEIPGSLQPDIAEIPGVAAAIRAEGCLQRISVDGRDDVTFVIAFEDSPATIRAFRSLGYARPPGKGEIIAHDSIAGRDDTVRLRVKSCA